MNEQDKSVALAKLMGWQLMDYGELVQELSGHFINLYGNDTYPLEPYKDTEKGNAQFAAIVLAHARDIVIEVANDISLHRYEEPTKAHILDTVLRMEEVL